MGKAVELCANNLRLRCVHCKTTETPLWRGGPDGPKTLCNACGVRFKKGKLALYKDESGNLTAVKSENALPVVVPPASKKNIKKIPPLGSAASYQDLKRTIVRKSPPPEAATATIAAAVGKKPRARSRRATAGQLPGRYANKTLPDELAHWRSPSGSPSSSPSSPSPSPDERDPRPGFLSSPTSLNLEEPSLYQFDDDNSASIFPDFAFLGIGSSGDSENATLLPMPADPSSTEQFSFAFAELGRDASLAIDLPDHIAALRTLVHDRTRKVSKLYDNSVSSLARLWAQKWSRKQVSFATKSTIKDRKPADYLKDFIRSLVMQQDPAVAFAALRETSTTSCAESMKKLGSRAHSPIMLPERSLYIAAVENLTNLLDSVQVIGFAEACLIELLAEDVLAEACMRDLLTQEKQSVDMMLGDIISARA